MGHQQRPWRLPVCKANLVAVIQAVLRLVCWPQTASLFFFCIVMEAARCSTTWATVHCQLGHVVLARSPTTSSTMASHHVRSMTTRRRSPRRTVITNAANPRRLEATGAPCGLDVMGPCHGNLMWMSQLLLHRHHSTNGDNLLWRTMVHARTMVVVCHLAAAARRVADLHRCGRWCTDRAAMATVGNCWISMSSCSPE